MRIRALKKFLGRSAVIVLLLIAQIATMIALLWHSTTQSSIASQVLQIISICVCLYIAGRRDKLSFKLTWIFVILCFPIFGGVLYLLFRMQSSYAHLQKKYSRYRAGKLSFLEDAPNLSDKIRRDFPVYENEIDYLHKSVGFPAYENIDAVYYRSGEEAFTAMLAHLRAAKRFIFLEFFIIDSGYMWDSIHDILRQKAADGVDIRIIYDDLGSMATLPRHFKKTLQAEGISARAFNPFRPLWTTLQNNRDHRKIVVVDGEFAMTGGFNIADEYINHVERFGHWKDAAVSISGEAVRSFTAIFLEAWASLTNCDINYNLFLPKETTIASASPIPGFVQPYGADPTFRESIGEFIYMQMITRAREYLYIFTPYLILDDTLRSALKLSARSGVDVRIVTPHIPDKKFVFLATRSNYVELLEAGVRIYEYTPGFIHAKCFVSDDHCAVVGTTNLDFRSLFLHFECGIRFYYHPVIRDIRRDLEDTFAQSHEISLQECRKRSVFVRMIEPIIRILTPLL